MGLFDRLLGSRTDSVKIAGQGKETKAASREPVFLDADASSSLGNVQFMRRSNTIRHTFPGTADSPGNKEMVAEVASMEARLETMSPGLAGINPDSDVSVDLTGGIPKPVKKTFAKPMSQAELEQRKRGTAVAANEPVQSAPVARKAELKEEVSSQPQITQQGGKPGDINPFKAMAKDLRN
ncbi:MAG: hypothetical protein ACKO0M_02375 [Cyanobium sp.]